MEAAKGQVTTLRHHLKSDPAHCAGMDAERTPRGSRDAPTQATHQAAGPETARDASQRGIGQRYHPHIAIFVARGRGRVGQRTGHGRDSGRPIAGGGTTQKTLFHKKQPTGQ